MTWLLACVALGVITIAGTYLAARHPRRPYLVVLSVYAGMAVWAIWLTKVKG